MSLAPAGFVRHAFPLRHAGGCRVYNLPMKTNYRKAAPAGRSFLATSAAANALRLSLMGSTGITQASASNVGEAAR